MEYKIRLNHFTSLTSILCLSLIILFVSSCKDDEEKPDPGYFTLDDTRYPIKSGAFFSDKSQFIETNPQTGEEIYFTDIALSGTQDIGIWIYLISGVNTLETGEYTFATYSIDTPYKPWDFRNCSVIIVDTQYQGFKAGSFKVVKAGDVYTFDLEATIDGHSLIAHFKGNIQIVD